MAEGKEIILDALVRALFGATPEMFDGFRWHVLQGRVRPCNSPKVLAHRVAKEMAHAGYVLRKDRYHAQPSAIQARMALEDHIAFGVEMTARAHLEALDSDNRKIATEARAAVVASICDTFKLGKVTLGKRKKTSSDR